MAKKVREVAKMLEINTKGGRIMNKLNVVIERAENNFSAYVREIDGITTTGTSIDEIKLSILEAVDEYIAFCNDIDMDIPEVLSSGFDIVFELDVQSLLFSMD